MKLSLAISALATYYVSGSTAFQQQSLTLARTNSQKNRIVVGDSHDTLLMAATMDGTVMTELVANGGRRKKTKEVRIILSIVKFGEESIYIASERVVGDQRGIPGESSDERAGGYMKERGLL